MPSIFIKIQIFVIKFKPQNLEIIFPKKVKLKSRKSFLTWQDQYNFKFTGHGCKFRSGLKGGRHEQIILLLFSYSKIFVYFTKGRLCTTPSLSQAPKSYYESGRFFSNINMATLHMLLLASLCITNCIQLVNKYNV